MLYLLNKLFKIECFCLILLACSIIIYTATETLSQSPSREETIYWQIEQERQQQEEEKYQERQTQLQEERQRRQEEQKQRLNQQRDRWQQRQEEIRQRE